MPFNGQSYDDVVDKNTKGKVNFDLQRYGVTVSDESLFNSDGPAEKVAAERPT